MPFEFPRELSELKVVAAFAHYGESLDTQARQALVDQIQEMLSSIRASQVRQASPTDLIARAQKLISLPFELAAFAEKEVQKVKDFAESEVSLLAGGVDSLDSVLAGAVPQLLNPGTLVLKPSSVPGIGQYLADLTLTESGRTPNPKHAASNAATRAALDALPAKLAESVVAKAKEVLADVAKTATDSAMKVLKPVLDLYESFNSLEKAQAALELEAQGLREALSGASEALDIKFSWGMLEDFLIQSLEGLVFGFCDNVLDPMILGVEPSGQPIEQMLISTIAGSPVAPASGLGATAMDLESIIRQTVSDLGAGGGPTSVADNGGVLNSPVTGGDSAQSAP